MSKIISGQRRVEDTSSATLGQFRHQGNGKGKMKGILPKPTLNKRLNPVKEHSHRGKNDKKGKINPKGSKLKGKSSFIEPSSFISIGGMRLTPGNALQLKKNNELKKSSFHLFVLKITA